MDNIYEFRLPEKILFGSGSLKLIGREAERWGRKALLVTGRRAMRETGILGRAREYLKKSGIEICLYEGVETDPSLETVERGTHLAQEKGCRLVIGLGGGSALDAAKAIAGMVTQEGSIEEYHEGRKICKSGLPFLALPTTAGTGTEVTQNSVLTNKRKRIKKSIRSPYLLPRLALVDPELTLFLPPAVTAASGLDALTHAVEAYVSLGAQPQTDALAIQAVKLIGANLTPAFHQGDNLKVKENVAMGSLLAGMSFANARLGAVHALVHPLGAKFGLSHGIACGLLLPYVMEFNLRVRKEKYAELGEALGEGREAAQAIDAVRRLLKEMGMPQRLREVGIGKEDIPELVEDTRDSGSLKVNPRPANAGDLKNILLNAF
jgi:alcohol dehydrogenase class IV